jgi:plastocyanin
MKKIYTLIFASAFLLFTNVNATTHNVSVTNNSFTPNNIPNAVIGDVIVWTFNAGTHTTTSTTATIPAGALPWDSGNRTSGTYSYTITTAGTYNYGCTLHATMGMIAQFTVSAVGILEPATDLLTQVYPNPFSDKLTVKFNGIEKIEFVNILGEKVKSVTMDSQEGKLDVYFDNLPAGVYFYSTYKEGNIVESRKLVKAR